MKNGSILVWFRNDLRLHDNEVLYKAVKNSENIVPIYCFDTKMFEKTIFDTSKTGAFRAKFLQDSVKDLRNNLKNKGAELIVEYGNPTEIVAQLAKEYGVKAVYAQKEITQEEIAIENALELALWKHKIPLELIWGNTLFHIDDIPFTIKDLPDIFTSFRKKVESESNIRPLFDLQGKIISHPSIAEQKPFELKKYGIKLADNKYFRGGETNALHRLKEYFWDKDLLKVYKETRNGLLGMDYSSKFSPWLSLGCISPRYIYHQIKYYEIQRIANESTYWLVFELLWRDYFKFVFKKYGNSFFKSGGIKNIETAPIENRFTEEAFEKWKSGETGVDFVDANMKELKNTGFMSNRGRQNVASFLVHDLKVNWLKGAAYFEEMLIDYDVCSNYGNWAYIAGVGNDPRENRKFNIEKQSRDYDPNREYINFWLNKQMDYAA